MSAFFSVLLLIAIPVIIGLCILRVAGWDGKTPRDRSQCDTCPFPRCDSKNHK